MNTMYPAQAWRLLSPGSSWPVGLQPIEDLLEDPEVVATLDRHEADESYPGDVIAWLRKAGVGSVLEGPGSPGFTAWHMNALNAIAARRDASLAITLGVNSLALLPVAVAGSPEQVDWVSERTRRGAMAALLLTELENGSNLLRNRARAERGRLGADATFAPLEPQGEATHYRLSGEKHLINGGQRHDLLVALLRTSEPMPGATGPLAAVGDFSVFLVERDDTVEALPRWPTSPARAADISGVRFRGTIVPSNQLVGGEGRGFSTIQKTLAISRGGITSLAAGASARAYELALRHARERDVYGGPILGLGAIADHLVQIDALDLACAAVSVKGAALVNAWGLGAAPFTAGAKLAACSLAEEAVALGRRVLGARALLREHPYERLVRDVALYGVFDGTSHVMLEQIHPRLAQLAHLARQGSPPPAPEAIGAPYLVPPRPLLEALRTRPPERSCLEAHVRALAAVPGIDLASLVATTRALFALVGDLRARGRWDPDQGVRFRAAETLAQLDAVIALVELGDPERRAALGLPAITGSHERVLRHPEAYRFALGLLGARLVARVRSLALETGSPAAGLDEIEAAFLREHASRRRSLREKITAP